MENLLEFKIVNIVSDIKIHFPPSLTKFSFPRLIFEVSPEDVCNAVSREQKRYTAICFKFMRARKPLLYNDYAEDRPEL